MRFFELAFPDARARITSNRLHTRLIRELELTERLRVIDTSYQLDGHYDEMFHDIMHFTQQGRERFVANLLVGLAPLLRAEPRMRCGRAMGARSPSGPPLPWQDAP